MFDYKTEIVNDDGTTEKVVLSFKDINLLPIGVLRNNRHSSTEEMWATLEWGLSDDQHALLDSLPTSELQKIMHTWQNSDGVEVGESDASSTSSNDTETRSKPISSEQGSG